MEAALIKQFYIEFDRQWSVYEPGDTVTGSLHLELNKRVICDQISAQVYGSARVFWVEREMTPLTLHEDEQLDPALLDDRRRGRMRRKPAPAVLRNVPYSQEKIYFDERIPLWSHQNSSYSRGAPGLDDIVKRSVGLRLNNANLSAQSTSGRPYLEPGKHKFDFQFPLPEHLPTSFDSTNAVGSVRYFVKAHISEFGQTKHSRKTLFTVVRRQDLNSHPELACPAFKTTQQKLTVGLCSKRDVGVVSIQLNARKTGYVPGEPLLVNAVVSNHSRRGIKGVTLQLVQKVVCHALISKTVLRVICAQSYTGAKLKKNGGACEFSPLLYVPAVTPTFEEADIITVSYKLVLVVSRRLNERQTLASLELPIVIGTVPIEGGAASAPAHGDTSKTSEHTELPTYESAVGFPPPSYEESVTGLSFSNQAYQTHNEGETNGTQENMHIRPPMYPVYQQGTTSSN